MESLNRDYNFVTDVLNTDIAQSNPKVTIDVLSRISEPVTIPTIGDPEETRSIKITEDFFKKLGEALFGFGQSRVKGDPSIGSVSVRGVPSGARMDLLRNHIVLDSTDFNDIQQQADYDKFMNDIWIGIVMTLIIISLVFCICSCFLYHQFRQWKRSYRHTLRQGQDIESVKLNPNTEDPVPEYSVVSGLPSYETALELMKTSTLLSEPNTASSCLIDYPSLFNVFNIGEKESTSKKTLFNAQIHVATTVPITTHASSVDDDVRATAPTITTPTPMMTASHSIKQPNASCLAEDTIPSYEEATGCPTTNRQQQQSCQQEQQSLPGNKSTSAMKSSAWCEDKSKLLSQEKKIEAPSPGV